MVQRRFLLRLVVGSLLLTGAVSAACVAVVFRAFRAGGGTPSSGVLWAAVLVAVCGAAVLAAAIAWFWYRPLRRMSQTARSIAAGDLSSRARLFETSELAELGTALNDMRQSLARQIALTSARGENLQTVVSNLREGVIATSLAGEIVLANLSATELLLPPGAAAPVGKRIQSVVRVLDILDLYNRAQSTGQAAKAQVEVELAGRRRNLEVHAIPLKPARSEDIGGLLVLHDVTDIARTAAIKAEFIANASHELRTPLAAIRAVSDNLSELSPQDPQELAKLSAMLDRHVRRLENLTRDLLDLHILESGRRAPQPEQIGLSSLKDWLSANFSPAARAKSINFEIDVQGEAPIEADRTLVELILQNLVDNAIKFTPSSGRVRVELSEGEGGARLTVSDTGCGIPAEAQGRVFERFFQVDQSRSGQPKVRGTGLGLAIVKHATDRLGGKVSLKSEVGVGTTVVVELPEKT